MSNSNASRSRAVLAAEAWIEVREGLDRQLSPLGLRAIGALKPSYGEVIVDVGCGTGQTVQQLAELVGPLGRVFGIDIAGRMLEVAQERTLHQTNVSFIEGDAAALTFPAASIDGFFSRFGVMALSDPVSAFARFHHMLKPNGRIAFVCWRSLDENELDALPLKAAGLEHMADHTPFKFERLDYVRSIMERSGFRNILIEAHDQNVSSGNLEAMVAVLLKVGPLGRIIRENIELRADAEPRVRAALAAKADLQGVSLLAAIWVVSAQA